IVKNCVESRIGKKRENGHSGCFDFRLPSCQMRTMDENISLLMGLIKIVIVDDRHLMRKVVRALLASIGVQHIFEAGDGVSGLDAICSVVPHVVLLDWDMPGMSGAEFVRKVRAPTTFAQRDVPIIILTGHSERSCATEAERLGV